MSNSRPILNKNLDSKLFQNHYYLKEELTEFCKQHHLPTTGGKIELSKRIAHYLETGEITTLKPAAKKPTPLTSITENSLIEPNFTCTEIHRTFFKTKINKTFTFNIAFQKWLKNNSGKTYTQAIEAYQEILKQQKTTQTTIDPQFEYNTYIRDYFTNNQNGNLTTAIKCWKFKKSQSGHNRYEKEDLEKSNQTKN